MNKKGDLKYVSSNKGKMKVFDTSDAAYKFAEDDSSIALYKEAGDGTLTFVRVAGLKTSGEMVANLLQNAE